MLIASMTSLHHAREDLDEVKGWVIWESETNKFNS
jgi:hypothetical protein